MTQLNFINVAFTAGAIICGAIVTFFVAKWQLRKTGEDLTETSKGLAAASRGIADSMATFRTETTTTTQQLVSVSSQIVNDVTKFRTETETHFRNLGELSRKIGDQVINIEEATRKLLGDFPDIFLEAETMLRRCRDRFWMLNFTPCFGEIHSYNKKYVRLFLKKIGKTDLTLTDEILVSAGMHDMQRRIHEFFGNLETRANTIANFKLGTIDQADFEEFFLTPVLSKMSQELIGAVETVKPAIAEKHRVHLAGIISKCAKKVEFLAKVPLQMFIADSGPNGESACLVYFIGTDNIAVEQEVKGFSTQYKPLVALFEEVFESIVKHQKKIY